MVVRIIFLPHIKVEKNNIFNHHQIKYTHNSSSFFIVDLTIVVVSTCYRWLSLFSRRRPFDKDRRGNYLIVFSVCVVFFRVFRKIFLVNSWVNSSFLLGNNLNNCYGGCETMRKMKQWWEVDLKAVNFYFD